MISKKYITLVLTVVLVLVGLTYVYLAQKESAVMGGDRDATGCLIAAGYSFDAEIGACIRAFEMTDDIRQAARLAVEHVGGGYALTVVSFNSYEELGAYDIMLERGIARERQTVIIRNGEVQTVE